jgi:hypothetical protein
MQAVFHVNERKMTYRRLWIPSSVCSKYVFYSVMRQLPIILVNTLVKIRFSGARKSWNLLTTLSLVCATIQLNCLHSLRTRWNLCPSVQVLGISNHSLWDQKLVGDCNTVSYCTIKLFLCKINSVTYLRKVSFLYHKIYNKTCSYIVWVISDYSVNCTHKAMREDILY